MQRPHAPLSLARRIGFIAAILTIDSSQISPLESSTMREIVHVQVGQCGNQIGAKFWEVRIIEVVVATVPMPRGFHGAMTVVSDILLRRRVFLLKKIMSERNSKRRNEPECCSCCGCETSACVGPEESLLDNGCFNHR